MIPYINSRFIKKLIFEKISQELMKTYFKDKTSFSLKIEKKHVRFFLIKKLIKIINKIIMSDFVYFDIAYFD